MKYGIEGVPEDVYRKFKESLNHPIKLQLFRTIIGDNIEETKELHRLHILQSIINSKYAQVKSFYGILFCMSGFVEKKGRLPNINDNIRIIRGRYYFDVMPDGYLTSEVGFEIIKYVEEPQNAFIAS